MQLRILPGALKKSTHKKDSQRKNRFRHYTIPLGVIAVAGSFSPEVQAGLFDSQSRREGVWMADRQVGSVDQEEVDQIRRRRRSLSLVGISFGPCGSSRLKSSSMQYGLDMTNHREVHENGELRIRGGGSVADDGSVRRGSLGLGGAFFPFRGDLTPFVGAELGVGSVWGRYVETGPKSVSGFTLAAMGGLRLFRTSDTQMELAGRYEVVLKANDYGRPGTWGASLAVLF